MLYTPVMVGMVLAAATENYAEIERLKEHDGGKEAWEKLTDRGILSITGTLTVAGWHLFRHGTRKNEAEVIPIINGVALDTLKVVVYNPTPARIKLTLMQVAPKATSAVVRESTSKVWLYEMKTK